MALRRELDACGLYFSHYWHTHILVLDHVKSNFRCPLLLLVELFYTSAIRLRQPSLEMNLLHMQLHCCWITEYFLLWVKSFKFKVLFPMFGTLFPQRYSTATTAFSKNMDAMDTMWHERHTGRGTRMDDTNIFELCPFLQLHHHGSHCLFTLSVMQTS